MTKFDLAIIDLDYTIFNTGRLKHDIYQVFKPFGLKFEDFLSAYRQAAELPEFGYYQYTFQKQIDEVKKIGVDIPDNLIEELEGLLKNNYRYSDTVYFLEQLKQYCHELWLLTSGTKEMQAKKIDTTNVRQYFNQVIHIDGNKPNEVAKAVEENKKIIFINDNLLENIQIKKQFNSVEVISVYNSDYWTESEYVDSGIVYFKSLSEIVKHIKNNYD